MKVFSKSNFNYGKVIKMIVSGNKGVKKGPKNAKNSHNSDEPGEKAMKGGNRHTQD